MNSADVLSHVNSLLYAPDYGSPCHSMRWHLLYEGSPRFMCVPHREFAVQRKCVRIFRPRWHQALAGDLQLLRARLPGRRNAVRRAEGPTVLDAAWLQHLGLREPSDAVIQVGTPGPYQKAAVALIAANGDAMAMAKIAIGEGADATVSREAQWLRRMDRLGELYGWMPRVVSEGLTSSGRRFLVTDVGPLGSVQYRLSSRHQQFLRRLGRNSLRVMAFLGSPDHERVASSIDDIEPHVSVNALQQLREAHRDCAAALHGWSGPMVIAHGDFAPWNTRTTSGRLYVFDWECARAEANPLYDLFHFLLLPRALRRMALVSRRRLMAQLIEQVRSYAQVTYGEWLWTRRTVSALALHYVLDLILYYGLADRGIDFEHPVIALYWRLMTERNLWLH